MGIFLVIVIIIVLCWPNISRWLKSLMARRAEDYIRRATGMPPRPGSREERRQQRASSASSGSSGGTDYGRRRQHRRTTSREPLIPKEYAEDVEFTETISYSETIIAGDVGKPSEKPRHPENQVSDAEWTDLP